MSSHLFRIDEHVSPCQHIREYPRATAHTQEDTLVLAVKQYTPLDNLNPKPGDVTVIAAHANGFPKELYEPLWDELLARSRTCGFQIRSIWIADVAQQGKSGILNEGNLGNDPAWHDHPRDLLHLINLKRDQMPRPIVGIGHSMGGNNLVNLSYIHPRLICTLILFDPVIHKFSSTPPKGGKDSPAYLSTYRRDLWPSREIATESFNASRFYKSWDPRVLDRWIQFGLRDLPTLIHPQNAELGHEPQVTLTTTKHQEVFTFLRPNYNDEGNIRASAARKTHPDLNDKTQDIYPFYRAEPSNTFLRLPELRPSVLYVFGELSDMSTSSLRQEKMELTGAGIGGSGGAHEGRVKEVVLKGVGHLVAMEAVAECADAIAPWIAGECQEMASQDEKLHREWSTKSQIEKTTIDEKWHEMMGPSPNQQKPRQKL